MMKAYQVAYVTRLFLLVLAVKSKMTFPFFPPIHIFTEEKIILEVMRLWRILFASRF